MRQSLYIYTLISCTATTYATNCASFGGKWYDSSSDDWMMVSEDNCVLTSKYGTARVDGQTVLPETGILSALKLKGTHNEGTSEVRWSNGLRWKKIFEGSGNAGGVGGGPAMDPRVDALQQAVEQLQQENQEMKEKIEQILACCKDNNNNNAGTPSPMSSTTPSPVSSTPSPGTASPTTPEPASAGTPGTPVSNGEIEELREVIKQLNETFINHKPRDGYCSVQPNVTSVYVPVVRYTRKDWVDDNKCVTGPVSPRGPPSVPGVPSMASTARLDPSCLWGDRQTQEPVLSFKGDHLVFWRSTNKKYNIYKLPNKKAYDECDFSKATLLAGLIDLEAMESYGRNFTYILDTAGEHYFASDKAGKYGDERKEYCKTGKIQVVVLDPTNEVLAECPLYDPAKFGVSANSGQQVDSESVERLKGAVGAITRQLISMEQRTQERVRVEGQSGITLTRSWNQGTDAYYGGTFVGSGPANMHNHADLKYTVGLGEFGAVLNGVQFTTRHNDFSMLQPDETLSVEEYKNNWPPKSRDIEFPPVPPSVLAKKKVEDQIDEMREYFRAFKEQNETHRPDYKKYFWANLCYLEGTWAVAKDNVAEPFASDRHHIDADTWEDLNQKTNFLFNNGQKSQAENLPFLPTSFREILKSKDGSVFEPKIGQWFYRITCMPINHYVPTQRFRVANDLHVQLGYSRPRTREALAQSNHARFELNPQLLNKYKDTNVWPKGRTTYEYLDELMREIPGFDGPNGYLEDWSFGPVCAEFGNNTVLNTAKYSRYYANLDNDAMGRNSKKRSFNDLLFAAQTTHPRVSPQTACLVPDDKYIDDAEKPREAECKAIQNKFRCIEHAQWDVSNLLGGAQTARCVWQSNNRCVYQKCWTQRWSYAIPLEIIYTTPLSNWNPYDIPFYEKNDPLSLEVEKGKGTYNNPYRGSNRKKFFRTPAAFFKDQTNVDPADTSGGVTFVKNSKGESKAVRASGHWIMFPEIEGVGKIRQRYPIMPIHEAGSTSWKEVKALQEVLLGMKSSKEIQDIVTETRSTAYGAALTLLDGAGHSHTIDISSKDMHNFQIGQRTMVAVESSFDVGHSHYVQLYYNSSKPRGNEFELIWCTTIATTKKNCPDSVKKEPTKCGKTSDGGDCCWGKCPDQHPGVALDI